MRRLEDACKHRNIPDCEFFINKRDYPHLKVCSSCCLSVGWLYHLINLNLDGLCLCDDQENLSEPYGFLFDKDDRNPDDDIPLTEHRYATYAPVMSFYVSKRFVIPS